MRSCRRKIADVRSSRVNRCWIREAGVGIRTPDPHTPLLRMWTRKSTERSGDWNATGIALFALSSAHEELAAAICSIENWEQLPTALLSGTQPRHKKRSGRQTACEVDSLEMSSAAVCARTSARLLECYRSRTRSRFALGSIINWDRLPTARRFRRGSHFEHDIGLSFVEISGAKQNTTVVTMFEQT